MRYDGLEDISSTAHLLEDYQGNLVEGQVISEEHLIESGRPPKRRKLKKLDRLTEIWAATFTFPIYLLRFCTMGLFFGTIGGYAFFIGHKYRNDAWEACRHDGTGIFCSSFHFSFSHFLFFSPFLLFSLSHFLGIVWGTELVDCVFFNLPWVHLIVGAALWVLLLSGLFAAVLLVDIIMGFWECSLGIGRICCLSHAYFLGLWSFLVLIWSVYSAVIFSSHESYTCNPELVLFGFSATISFLVVGFSCLMICLLQQCVASGSGSKSNGALEKTPAKKTAT